MSRNYELEAKVIALEAAMKTIALPIWKALTPEDTRELQIESLQETARTGDDFYTNREFAQMIADELRRWAEILDAASQSPAEAIPEPAE